MPLTFAGVGPDPPAALADSGLSLVAGCRHPSGALAGLWLYFNCEGEAHRTCQEDPSAEGSYWHAILHRREPDPGNSAYWFRRTGTHPVFSQLQEQSKAIADLGMARAWDPFRFVDYCESAHRKPGSAEEQIAQQVQLLEWQLLLQWCAQEKK